MVSGSAAPWAAVGALAPAVRAALAQAWVVLPAVVQPGAARAAVVGSLAAGPSAAGPSAVGSSAAVFSAGPARPGLVLQMQEARRWGAPTAGLASPAARQAPPAPAGGVGRPSRRSAPGPSPPPRARPALCIRRPAPGGSLRHPVPAP